MSRRIGSAALLLCISVAHAQGESTAPALTLSDAQQFALANRPLLRVGELSVAVARQQTAQVESARYPQLYGSVTAATASRETEIQGGKEVALDTRIAAGGLNNPTVLRRDAAGVIVSQLVTDFGRTSRLLESAKLAETAQQHQLAATRAQVLLEVTNAYYSTLGAQAVLGVATKTVDARRLLLDRITAMMKSKLKSELDVRFAQVSLDEARLLLLRAQNGVDSAFARLSTSMGLKDTRRFFLAEESGQAEAPPELEALLERAVAQRPELATLRANHEAAGKFVQAQKALRFPTVNVFAAAGVVPIGDERFPRNYGAIGINLSVPLFDGGKIRALQEEARLKALASSENVSEAENIVVREVRVAWLRAKASYENIEITEHLKEAASQALKLAASRYDLGITSIVELNQAQLSAIDAEIGYSRAKYEYSSARSELEFQVGALQ